MSTQTNTNGITSFTSSLPDTRNSNVHNVLNTFASDLQNTHSGAQSLFANSGGTIPRNASNNTWSSTSWMPQPLTYPNNIPIPTTTMSTNNPSHMNGAMGQPPQAPPPISQEDMNKPLQSLTLGDMWRVLVQPLSAKIDNLENSVTQRVDGLNRRVQVLENELSKEVTKTEQLSNTIINMQRSLNKIDANERANNLIVMGLPEEAISNGTVDLTTDMEKFSYITRSINLPDIAENHVQE